MKALKNFIAEILTRIANPILCRLRNRVPTNFSREEMRNVNFGFGQYMEDFSVVRWANILQIREGIYVDVGSHHPVFCSNTLLLHKRGWRGINIDMNAARTSKFDCERPNDFNVTAAISDQEVETEMLSYPSGGTDRLAISTDTEKKSLAGETATAEASVRTQTLDSVLADSPFDIPRIDYLNVDIEGHDLEALRGLNFDKYRPAIISIEATTDDNMKGLLKFLEPLGYRMEEKLFDTLLLIDTHLPADRSKLYG